MQEQDTREQGFTLIELLIAIVVVGILTAVAIVGIGGLTDKGNGSACSATIDAATSAAAVYYANHNGVYPADFNQMTSPQPNPGASDSPPVLELASGVKNNGSSLNGNGWTVVFGSPGHFTGTVTATGAACK